MLPLGLNVNLFSLVELKVARINVSASPKDRHECMLASLTARAPNSTRSRFTRAFAVLTQVVHRSRYSW